MRRRHPRGGLRPLPPRSRCDLCRRRRRLIAGRVYCRRCARRSALPGATPSLAERDEAVKARIVQEHAGVLREAAAARRTHRAASDDAPVPGPRPRRVLAALAALAAIFDPGGRRT